MKFEGDIKIAFAYFQTLEIKSISTYDYALVAYGRYKDCIIQIYFNRAQYFLEKQRTSSTYLVDYDFAKYKDINKYLFNEDHETRLLGFQLLIKRELNDGR